MGSVTSCMVNGEVSTFAGRSSTIARILQFYLRNSGGWDAPKKDKGLIPSVLEFLPGVLA